MNQRSWTDSARPPPDTWLPRSNGRRTELARFLHALGMPGVGLRTARSLADAFGMLDDLRSADERKLREVVGPSRAVRVAAFLRRQKNRRVIDPCFERGLHVEETAAA